MTEVTPAAPFDFTACKGTAADCKAGMALLLSPHMDWSEVHCGRCGAQGVVRHADVRPAAPTYLVVPETPPPSAPPSTAAAPAPAPAPAPAAAGTGAKP